MKKIIPILTLLLAFASQPLVAQSWKQKLKEMKDRIEHKVEAQQREVDARYAEHLRRVWQKVEFVDAPEPFDIPKPDQTPIYDPRLDESLDMEEFDFDVFPTNPAAANDRPDFSPIAPRRNPPEEELVEQPRQERDASFNELPADIPSGDFRSELSSDQLQQLNRMASCDFYGTPFPLYYNDAIHFSFDQKLNERQVGDAWSRLEAGNYELLLYQFVRQANAQNLNDWAYCQLINSAAKHIYPGDYNAQTMFNLFFLSKSGYVVGISYHADRLYLMFPSLQTIYGTTFLRGKDYKYYIVDLNGGHPQVDEAYVFNKTYPDADRLINFRFFRAPKLAKDPMVRRLSFTYEDQKYNLPVRINRNLIDFYKTYPFTDLDVPMSTPLSEDAYRTLVPPLQQVASGLTEKEGVDMLLRFCQTAFEYKTDESQFGVENYLFAEETLFYPASDCEDRSILFAYLVQEVMGLDVVGLIFPGHAATAVRFNEEVSGDFITYKGERYLICDPTYIDATAGLCMPEVREKRIKVVDF